METLLWVLVPLLILGIGWWWLTRTRKRTSEEVAGAIGPQAAAEASARLDAEAHRAVYRKLATADFMGAVKEYRVATGQGIKQCIIAIRSLEAHPQVYKARAAASSDAETGPAAAGGDAAGAPEALDPSQAAGERHSRSIAREPVVEPGVGTVPDSDADNVARSLGRTSAPDAEQESGEALLVPDDWSEQFGSTSSRTTSTFRISAEQDGKTREFSTEELPPSEYDQFQSLIRDHDFAGAAALLAKFSGLDEDSIRQLLESAPVEGPASAASKNVSDFSFEGDGPNGRVSFSAADLPGEDRQLFLEHVGAGRTDEAAAIVHRHTGLPLGVVVKLLSAFGGGR